MSELSKLLLAALALVQVLAVRLVATLPCIYTLKAQLPE